MEGIPTEFILIGLLVASVAWLMIATRLQNARWVIAAMLFSAAIGVHILKNGIVQNTWLYQVQNLRSEAFLGCGLILIASFLVVLGKLSFQRVPVHGWFLLAIAIYQGLIRLIHESPIASAQSMIFAAVTIGPLVLIVPAMLNSRENFVALLRALLLANVAYLGACVVQFGLDPNVLTLTSDNRFLGMSQNPINAAVFLSVCGAIALWLSMNDQKYRHLSKVWVALMAVDWILVVGTGSREGLMLIVIAVTVLFYRRMGRAMLLLPLAAGAVWVALQVLSVAGIELGFGRVTSLEDTRSYTWRVMLEAAMQSPIVGVGSADVAGGVAKSENSYLYGFASFGVGMLLLLLAYTAVVFGHCVKLFRASFGVPSLKPTIDLILMFHAMYFFDALLAGTLVARVEPQIIFIIIFASMSTSILQGRIHPAAEELGMLEEEEMWDERDYEYGYGYDQLDYEPG